jgi:hypothetical protein
VGVEAHGLANGYRSGLEAKAAAEYRQRGYDAPFEKFKLKYSVPATTKTYTWDFTQLWNGIVVETKGRFVTADRKKHLYIQDQFPDLDIRFVFSNSKQKIGKASPTTYAMWCAKAGFQYADKSVPEAWLKEPPCPRRMAALKALMP